MSSHRPRSQSTGKSPENPPEEVPEAAPAAPNTLPPETPRTAWWRHKRDIAGEIRAAVEAADSLDEELEALVMPLEPRHQAMVLARWGRGIGPIPTLAATGAAQGVRLERVRQVVRLHETTLEELVADGLRLHHAHAAAEAIRSSRRKSGTRTVDLVALLSTRGISATQAALGALRGLSAARLIPAVEYDIEKDVWRKK